MRGGLKRNTYFVKAPTRVREWVYGYQRVYVLACACLLVSLSILLPNVPIIFHHLENGVYNTDLGGGDFVTN